MRTNASIKVGCPVVGSERLFTLPNALTFVRLPLAALIWAAPGERAWLLGILAVAAATDVLDGRVARAIRARRMSRGEDPGRLGEAHALGSWLDPLCDKLFVLSVVGAVAYAFRPPLYQVALIAAREIILVPFALAYALVPSARRLLRVDFRAGVAGKATTVIQFAAVAAIVFLPGAAIVLCAAAAAAGLVASVLYLHRAIGVARHAGRPGFRRHRFRARRGHGAGGRPPRWRPARPRGCRPA